MIRILSTLVAIMVSLQVSAVTPGLPYNDNFLDQLSINSGRSVVDFYTDSLGETNIRIPLAATTSGTPFSNLTFIDLDISDVDSLITNPTPSSNVAFFAFRSGDFNGDGHKDLAAFFSDTSTVNTSRSSSLLIYIHSGDNTNPYNNPPLVRNNLFIPRTAFIEIHDINNDGIDEIYTTGDRFQLINQFNVVNNIISSETIINFVDNTGARIVYGAFTFLKINNDDLLDLAINRPIEGIVEFYINNGNPVSPYSDTPKTLSMNPLDLIGIDIDNDGDDDLVTTGFGLSADPELRFVINDDEFDSLSSRNFMIGTRTSSFPNTDSLYSGRYPFELNKTDFNSDGNLDIAVTFSHVTTSGFTSTTGAILINKQTDFSANANLSNSFTFDQNTTVFNNLPLVSSSNDYRPNFDMSSNFADYNQDGYLELAKENSIFTNIAGNALPGIRGLLALNSFSVSNLISNTFRVSSNFFDYDNDGLIDFATYIDLSGSRVFRIYRNLGTAGTPSPSENKHIAQSHNVESVNLNTNNIMIDTVTLNAVDNIPVHTSIKYFVTNTGGNLWHRVQKGTEFIFPSMGTGDVRWRAVLETETPYNSPSISSVTLAPPDITPPDGYTLQITESFINSSSTDEINVQIGSAEVSATYELTISGVNGSNIVQTGTVTSESFTISNIDTSGFDDGQITASLVLTDLLNNVGNAVTQQIDKDRVAPTGYSISIPDSSINQNESTNFSIALNNAEVGTMYTVVLTDSNNQIITLNGSVSSATVTLNNIDLSSLDDGTITVSANLTDSVQNSGMPVSDSFNLDKTPPASYTVEIVENPNLANNSLLDIRITNAEVGASFSYTITSNSGGTPITNQLTVTQASFLINDLNLSSFNEGNFTITSSLTDAVNNVTTGASVIGIKDTLPPSIDVTYPSSQVNSTNSSAVSLSINTIELNVDYQLTVTSSNGGVPFVTSGTSSATTFNESLNLENLNDGTLSFTWLLTDQQGNSATIQGPSTVVLDTTPVVGHTIQFDNNFVNASNQLQTPVSITSIPADSLYSTPQTYTASYTITSDNGGTPITGNDTITGSTSTLNISGISALNDGTLTISYVITDSAGNQSTPVTSTISKDTVVPAVGGITLTDSPLYINDLPSNLFVIDNGETGTNYQSVVTIDSSGFTFQYNGTINTASESQSLNSIQFPGVGNATLTTTVVDDAGNSTEVVNNFIVTRDIDFSITNLPDRVVDNENYSLNIQFNQPVTGFTLSDLSVLGLTDVNLTGSGSNYVLSGTTAGINSTLSITLQSLSVNGDFSLPNRNAFSIQRTIEVRNTTVETASGSASLWMIAFLGAFLIFRFRKQSSV